MSGEAVLRQVRSVLCRLEETIIFALIERGQFLVNRVIYEPGAFGPELGGESLVDYLLHETEKIHASVRRYLSPDEHPFFPDPPAPILPPLDMDDPLQPNNININGRIRRVYETEVVPHICAPGDDKQYGSSSTGDVICLQSLSRRIHYGKFVAESKYRGNPDLYMPAIAAADSSTLQAMITDPAVENEVLERVRLKASAYGRGTEDEGSQPMIDPETVVEIYERWIIPMNKEVQLAYLLQRQPGRPGAEEPT
jgi:chorismate mutase